MKKILTICGSIKSNSTNEAVIQMLKEMASGKVQFYPYDISTLPFFNPDLDNENVPQQIIDFLGQLAEADAVIICTPEYIFSLPGVLKNAIEWTVSSSGFSGKHVGLIVASSLGEKALESLRLIMQTIEAVFDENTVLLLQGAKAKINNEETKQKLQALLNALLAI